MRKFYDHSIAVPTGMRNIFKPVNEWGNYGKEKAKETRNDVEQKAEAPTTQSE